MIPPSRKYLKHPQASTIFASYASRVHLHPPRAANLRTADPSIDTWRGTWSNFALRAKRSAMHHSGMHHSSKSDVQVGRFRGFCQSSGFGCSALCCGYPFFTHESPKACGGVRVHASQLKLFEFNRLAWCGTLAVVHGLPKSLMSNTEGYHHAEHWPENNQIGVASSQEQHWDIRAAASAYPLPLLTTQLFFRHLQSTPIILVRFLA